MAVRKKKLSSVEKREKARNTTYTQSGSRAESDEMLKLQSDLDEQIMKYNHDLSDYIAQSEDWLNQPETLGAKRDMMSEMYNRQMIMMCVIPLARGLSIDSVTQSVGVYAGICLINKDFKNSVKRNMNAMFGPQIDAFAEEINKRYGADSILGKGADKLKKWRDNMIMQEHGGRMPYTPQSAAVQDLALHKMAFIAMREPGADIEKIKKQHTEARERLFELAERDGVSKEDICQQVRTIIGKQCMFEERQNGFTDYYQTNGGRFNYTAGMYEETAGGGSVYREDYHEESVLMHDEDGKPYMKDKDVWNGEYFVRKNGGEVEYEGDFTPRAPRTPQETVDRVEMMFKSAVMNSKDGRTLFNNMMSIAYASGGNPEAGFELGDTMSGKGTDSSRRQAALYNNVIHAYETFRDAQCDNMDMQELYGCTSRAWEKVCTDTLSAHPDWADEFKKASEEEVQRRPDIHKGRQSSQEEQTQSEQKDTDSVKREYHNPNGEYDFDADDKSVENRSKLFEQKYAHVLKDANSKQAQLGME